MLKNVKASIDIYIVNNYNDNKKSWCFKMWFILKHQKGKGMKVKLTKVQKKVLCICMAKHITELRALLHLNQKEFSAMCGISTDRLSRIENGHVVMTWSQLLSVFAICNMNLTTKEYLFMNNVVPIEFFQYIQQLDETIPPIYNTILRDEVIEVYRINKNHKEEETII